MIKWTKNDSKQHYSKNKDSKKHDQKKNTKRKRTRRRPLLFLTPTTSCAISNTSFRKQTGEEGAGEAGAASRSDAVDIALRKKKESLGLSSCRRQQNNTAIPHTYSVRGWAHCCTFFAPTSICILVASYKLIAPFVTVRK